MKEYETLFRELQDLCRERRLSIGLSTDNMEVLICAEEDCRDGCPVLEFMQ